MRIDSAARKQIQQQAAAPQASRECAGESRASRAGDAFQPAAPRAAVSKSTAPNSPIRDNQATSSTLRFDDAGSVDKLKLNLDVAHTYKGDLVVTLTSPSGKSAVVHNRTGGSADNVKGSFDLSQFAGEPLKGDWKLTVEDKARGDTGTLKSWGLEITPKDGPPPPPPPPPGDDSDPMKHIEILASDEMRGRDSPSEGLDKASKYATDLMKKYGLTGPNTTNAANPFEQTFDLWSFRGQQPHAQVDGSKREFGQKLFEEGFYLDRKLSKKDLKVLQERYQETGLNHVAPVEFNNVDDVKQVAVQDGKVRNTMGLLKGTGPHKDEVIVVMAHLDHVGVDSQGRPFNGADDNASGSSVLLSALPQLSALQQQGKLDRSVLFVFTGAEEKGLVGSKYLADHPLPGIGSREIVGVVNMDMVGRWDDQRLSVIDTKSNGQANYFRPLLDKANQKLSDPFDRINRDINQYRDRQDGSVWSSKGEDVLFMFEGLSNPNGGGSLIPEYHRQDDDVQLIYRDSNGNKPRRMRDLFVNVVEGAANRTVQAAPRFAQEERGTVAWQ